MLYKDLVDEVVDIVQDPKIGDARTKNLLNEGYLDSLYRTTEPLPALETTGEARTTLDQAFTALPDDYLRNLEIVYCSTQDQRLTILGSLQLLKIKYPGLAKTGNIEHVAVSNRLLYYQGIPSTRRTLSLNYFCKPTLMSNERDEPTMLPENLHRRLLVNYACKELFSRIEDGMDGRKNNTAYHAAEYNKAFADLELWIIPRATEPIEINDVVTEYME